MLLTVMLPLQPLLASVQEVDNLPACCRRNGKHHCMMMRGMMDAALASSSSHPALTPPPCPWKLAVVPALVATAAAYFVLRSQRAPAGRVATVKLNFLFLPIARSQSTRAPPAVLI